MQLQEQPMLPDMRRWWTLVAMAGALTMVMLDGTGVSVTLPRIQRDLALSQGALQWILTIYALTLAATLTTGGRLGDLFGRVPVFVTGVILFASGSFICALAPSLPMLLAGRVIEGVAYVLMIPAAAVLVNEAFEPGQRGRAMGIYAALGGVFMVLGPLLSGALVEFVGWRAVFLVNLPVAVVTLVLLKIAKPIDIRPPPLPLLIPHTLLLMSGLIALVLGLQESHNWHWLSLRTLGFMGMGLMLLAAFAWIQLRMREPLLDVRLFLDRGFTADSIVLYCAQFALAGQMAFISIYLQSILHFTPLRAGFALLLILTPWVLLAPVAGRLYDRFSVKLTAGIGMALISAGYFLEALAFPGREFLWIAPCMVIAGAGFGMALPQTYTHGMSRVPVARRGQAYGVLDTMRQLGSAMGMAVIGSVVAGQERERIVSVAMHYTGTALSRDTLQNLLDQAAQGQTAAIDQLRQQFPAALSDLIDSGAASISDGYYLGGAVAALGLIFALILNPGKEKP